MAWRYGVVIVFVGCIFGSSFLLLEVVMRELRPLTIGGGRAVFAAAACWAFLLIRRKKIPRDPVLLCKLGLLGVFTYALPFILAPISQTYISTGLVAIISVLMPVSTVAISHFWPGGEKANRTQLLGVLIGFGGAVVLFAPALSNGSPSQLWAMMLTLFTTLLFAVSFNISRSFALIDPSVIATFALTGAALVAAPAGLIVDGWPHIGLMSTLPAWLWLGVFSTAMNFQIMYFLLPRIGATNFSINAFITPIVAVVLGVTLLGERVLPIQLAGMATIFIGLIVMDGRLLRRLVPASA